MTLLSILIPTIVEREEQFKKLKDFLYSQIIKNRLEKEVEILFIQDDRVYPIGAKRNALIQSAKGKYIVFIDDDDWVSDDYVKLIYDALNTNDDIDCVGIKGLLRFKGWDEREFHHSIKYKSYSDDEAAYYRPPNQLNPIKRSIAIKYTYKNINLGEDTDVAMRISNDGVLKKESEIDKVIYFYNFDPDRSATQVFSKGKEKVGRVYDKT